MPSTRSSAPTKCISEVPGLAKQTSTPPLTRVRTRLSAPFIVPLPIRDVFLPDYPQINHCSRFWSKGCGALLASPCVPKRAFGQRWNWKLTAHAAVACEISGIMACLAAKSLLFARLIMTRVLVFLIAAAALLSGTAGASAQVDMRDIMGGGPN